MQELVSGYVAALRRLSVCVALCVLLLVCVRYRDPVQQSLEVLQQLRETQSSLQEALRRAGECPGKTRSGVSGLGLKELLVVYREVYTGEEVGGPSAAVEGEVNRGRT